MQLTKKMAEQEEMAKTIQTEMRQCDEQIAAWTAKKQEWYKSQLVLEGRLAQLRELLQEAGPTPRAEEKTFRANEDGTLAEVPDQLSHN